MEIHRELGKGHDEVIYKDALVVELSGCLETARRSISQFRRRFAGMEKGCFMRNGFHPIHTDGLSKVRENSCNSCPALEFMKFVSA